MPQVGKRACVCGPFKEASEISVSFLLIQKVRIPSDIYSQIFWKFLFPGLRLWAGEPHVGLGPFPAFGGGGLGEEPAAPPPVGAGPAQFLTLPTYWL